MNAPIGTVTHHLSFLYVNYRLKEEHAAELQRMKVRLSQSLEKDQSSLRKENEEKITALKQQLCSELVYPKLTILVAYRI